jgi:serine/threonine protein phosphatase PrpC
MTVTVTLRATSRSCIQPLATSSSNRSRRPISTSIKKKPQWNKTTQTKRQQSSWTEIKDHEKVLKQGFCGKSTMTPYWGGLASIIAGSILLSQNEDEKENNGCVDDEHRLKPLLTSKATLLEGSDNIIDTSKALAVSPTFAASTSFAEDIGEIKRTFPNQYDISVRALKGSRLAMEDEYYIANGGRFAAVFDGHGGGGVSKYLREDLYTKIMKHVSLAHGQETSGEDLKNSSSDSKSMSESKASIPEPISPTPNAIPRNVSIRSLVTSIRNAFQEAETEVLQRDNLQYQGSTALAVWLHEDSATGDRTLLSANLGDSRAILCRDGKAIDVTRDHKPDDEQERERLVAMGEHIEWDDYSQVHRVRNLSLSRAIGDRFAKPAVSGEVEIKLFPISSRTADKGGDEFVVLASDGLWDVMTSQDCVNYVDKRLNDSPLLMRKMMSPTEIQRQRYTRRKNMSRYLANEALRRGSGDNVCVIVVWLNGGD